MPDIIGIAGCSGPGAALCYETICAEAPELLGPYEHPEIVLHAFSFGEHVRLLERGDWRGVADLMVRSASKLAKLGAAFAICPDNTVHQAMEFVEPVSPIPWLHIARVVAEQAAEQGLRRLGVLGTRYLMEGPVYVDALVARDIARRIPDASDREVVNSVIFDELVFARVTDEGRAKLARIIEKLARKHGCDGVVLGCTELPLAVTADMSPVPLLDSTRLLARAAIRRAIDGSDT